MDKSSSFYQFIGFTLKIRWENYYAQLTAPGTTLWLHPRNEIMVGSNNTSIGFTTDDYEGTKNHLSSLAIHTQTREEEGGMFIHFADPDGTLLYFIKPKWG